MSSAQSAALVSELLVAAMPADRSTPHDATPGVTGQGRRRVLGVRLHALAEIVAFLGMVTCIAAVSGRLDGLAGLSPHPFWVAVLLAAAWYGTNEALAAAVASSITLALLTATATVQPDGLHGWLLTTSVEPVLWFVAAVVLGERRGALRREADALAAQLAEARTQATRFAAAYERAAALRHELEARLAGQVRTVNTLFEASRAIDRPRVGDVLLGVGEVVRAVLAPTKFSLFLLHDNTLEAAVCEGWGPGDAFCRRLEADSPLHAAVVARRECLVAADPAQAALLGAEGLVAAPIVSTLTGAVVGMLKIEDIDFSGLQPATLEDFRVVCRWIGEAFAKAQRIERLERDPCFDASRGWLTAAFLAHAEPMLARASRSAGAPAASLRIAIDAAEPADELGRQARARLLAHAVDDLLGDVGLRFECAEPGRPIAVVLPGIDAASARPLAAALARAIRAALAGTGEPARVSCELRTLEGHAVDVVAAEEYAA